MWSIAIYIQPLLHLTTNSIRCLSSLLRAVHFLDSLYNAHVIVGQQGYRTRLEALGSWFCQSLTPLRKR